MSFEQFIDKFPQGQRNMHAPRMPGGPGQGYEYHRQGGYEAIWDKFRREHNVPQPHNNGFNNLRYQQRFYGGSKFTMSLHLTFISNQFSTRLPRDE